MKAILTSVVFLFIATGAFAATTYQCDQLTNDQGEALLGGPSYAVKAKGDEVILLVTEGADEGGPLTMTERKMSLVGHFVEFSSYRSGNVTVNIGSYYDGIWRNGANITVKQADDTYSANCD